MIRFTIILAIILSSFNVYSKQKINYKLNSYPEQNKVILINGSGTEYVFQVSDSLALVQAEFSDPFICILSRNKKNNNFTAKTFLITEEDRIIQNSTLTDIHISDENIKSDSNIECIFKFNGNKLSFCVWNDDEFGSLQPYNFRFNKDEYSPDGIWTGYPDSKRDEHVKLSPERYILGFQQCAVDVENLNGSWTVNDIFNPEIPYCEFSNGIDYIDGKLIICPGVCCVVNESLVLIYELIHDEWNGPTVLGLKDIDNKLHYLAYFQSYQNGVISIEYRCHEKGDNYLKTYEKINGKWIETRSEIITRSLK
ncbi:MAG: hypothetical protein JXB49_05710 [Bacteroidales bacterium]|nr:hypothetical protein [Bacteroidales bacterium]